MKLKVTFSLILLFCLYSCNNKKPTEPVENNNNNTVSEQIGNEGGTLTSTSGDFQLTVPKGAFGSTADLTLYKMSGNPFDSNSNSASYKVEGIPEDFSKPLEISIKSSSEVSGTPIIAVGENGYAPSSGERTAYIFYQAADSGGIFSCQITPVDSTNNSFSKNQSTMISAQTLIFDLILGNRIYISRNDNFKILYPIEQSESEVSALGDDLEAAYKIFSQIMGVTPNSRIGVCVDKMADTLYGETVFGYTNLSISNAVFITATMEFNKLNLSDAKEVRITAGHEYFHIIQYLFYPFKILPTSSKYTWLDEAFAVWSEKFFQDNDNYVSKARKGNEWTPFLGLQSNSTASDEAAKYHGYGVSAMIEYLANNYQGNFPYDVYSKVTENQNPVDAIINTYGKPVDWWSDFLTEYMEGKIYSDLTPAKVLNNISSSPFIIKTDADTLKTFTDDFPDLSGKVYDVELENQSMDDNTSLQFSTDGEFSDISVFKYKNNEIVKLAGPSKDEVEITEIKQLQDEGWNLVCLVSNYRAVSPFTSSVSIKTNIKLKTQKSLDMSPFTHIYMDAQWHGTYTRSYNGGDVIDKDANVYIEINHGTWTGNVYTGDTTVVIGSDNSYKDSVKVVIDPVTLKVTEFFGYHEKTFGGDSYTVKITGSNLKLQFYGSNYSGNEGGTSACSVLTTVESDDEYFTGDYVILQSYNCNNYSYINIGFMKPSH